MTERAERIGAPADSRPTASYVVEAVEDQPNHNRLRHKSKSRCSRTGVTMIHFCLAHSAYHVHCWLPRSHQLRLRVTVLLSGVTTLALQFYVLLRPSSSRYCSQPLLNNLVANIAFTFFAFGFTVLLTHMDPVPQALKKMFSVYGVGSFGEGVCTMVLTVLATDCEKTTPELYYLSVLLSVSSLVSTALFSGLGLLRLASTTCARPAAKPTV